VELFKDILASVIKVIFKPSIEIYELVSKSFEKPKLEKISCPR
jgi:hypothetical protein